jgi:hypothetical protein
VLRSFKHTPSRNSGCCMRQHGLLDDLPSDRSIHDAQYFTHHSRFAGKQKAQRQTKFLPVLPTFPYFLPWK